MNSIEQKEASRVVDEYGLVPLTGPIIKTFKKFTRQRDWVLRECFEENEVWAFEGSAVATKFGFGPKHHIGNEYEVMSPLKTDPRVTAVFSPIMFPPIGLVIRVYHVPLEPLNYLLLLNEEEYGRETAMWIGLVGMIAEGWPQVDTAGFLGRNVYNHNVRLKEQFNRADEHLVEHYYGRLISAGLQDFNRDYIRQLLGPQPTPDALAQIRNMLDYYEAAKKDQMEKIKPFVGYSLNEKIELPQYFFRSFMGR